CVATCAVAVRVFVDTAVLLAVAVATAAVAVMGGGGGDGGGVVAVAGPTGGAVGGCGTVRIGGGVAVVGAELSTRTQRGVGGRKGLCGGQVCSGPLKGTSVRSQKKLPPPKHRTGTSQFPVAEDTDRHAVAPAEIGHSRPNELVTRYPQWFAARAA